MDSTGFSTPISRLIVVTVVVVLVGVLEGQLATDPENNSIAPPGFAIAPPQPCTDCSVCPTACSGANVYPPPQSPPPVLSYDHVPPPPHQTKGNCPPATVVVCCPYAPPPPATAGAFPYVPYNNYSGSSQTGVVLGCVMSGVFLSWFSLVFRLVLV